jgi:hypothetical protein
VFVCVCMCLCVFVCVCVCLCVFVCTHMDQHIGTFICTLPTLLGAKTFLGDLLGSQDFFAQMHAFWHDMHFKHRSQKGIIVCTHSIIAKFLSPNLSQS